MPRSTSAHRLDEFIHREDHAPAQAQTLKHAQAQSQGAGAGASDLLAARRRVLDLIDEAIAALSDPAFARDVAELRALAMEAEEAPWMERLEALLERAEAIVLGC